MERRGEKYSAVNVRLDAEDVKRESGRVNCLAPPFSPSRLRPDNTLAISQSNQYKQNKRADDKGEKGEERESARNTEEEKGQGTRWTRKEKR